MKSWLLAVALVPPRRHPRQCRIVSESEHQDKHYIYYNNHKRFCREIINAVQFILVDVCPNFNMKESPMKE